MRTLLASAFISLICAAPALAQHERLGSAARQDQSTPNPSAAVKQAAASDAQLVEDALKAQLADAGLTSIELIPTSFLVRAKDAEGNAVLLVVPPESVAEELEALSQRSSAAAAPPVTPSDEERF